ncbi:MAG: HAD-IA family hydrolase [Bdellovibrionales bacterium]|nr:HAD-IA family hydrolase [Bdellovibrionales bacterium]
MIDTTRLRAVFFDADDTLYSVRESVGTQYHPHFKAHDVHVTIEEIDTVVPLAWQALTASYENREDNHITTHERDESIWREYVQNVLSHFSDKPVTESLYQSIYHEFAKPESRVLSPYVTELLHHLREKGYITGVLTNNDKRVHTLIEGLGLAHHFDFVFCASDLGYKKPAKEVFHRLAEKANCTASELLYIGDCPHNDIQGAFNAGCQALWYNINDTHSYDLHRNTPSVQCFRFAKQLFS